MCFKVKPAIIMLYYSVKMDHFLKTELAIPQRLGWNKLTILLLVPITHDSTNLGLSSICPILYALDIWPVFEVCYILFGLSQNRKINFKNHTNTNYWWRKKKEKKQSKTMIHAEFVIHPEPLGFNYRLFQGQVAVKADVRTDHQRGDSSVLLPTGESSSTL